MPPKRNGRRENMKAINAEKRAKKLAAASGASATVVVSDDERDENWAEEEPGGMRPAPDLATVSAESDDAMSEAELLDEERPGGRSARLSAAEPWRSRMWRRSARSATATWATGARCSPRPPWRPLPRLHCGRECGVRDTDFFSALRAPAVSLAPPLATTGMTTGPADFVTKKYFTFNRKISMRRSQRTWSHGKMHVGLTFAIAK